MERPFPTEQLASTHALSASRLSVSAECHKRQWIENCAQGREWKDDFRRLLKAIGTTFGLVLNEQGGH